MLTSGGFAAIVAAVRAVADPGDEFIFSLLPWFFYEPVVVEAGLVPIKVRIDPETRDLDAIAAAITAANELRGIGTIRPDFLFLAINGHDQRVTIDDGNELRRYRRSRDRVGPPGRSEPTSRQLVAGNPIPIGIETVNGSMVAGRRSTAPTPRRRNRPRDL